MEIQSNFNVGNVGNPPVTQSRVRSRADNLNPPQFEATERLEQALKDTPDVRPEAVALGKALVADPAYPSKAIVSGVARLIAEHLSQPGR